MLWWILGSVGGAFVLGACVLLVLRHRFRARTRALWRRVDRPAAKEAMSLQEHMLAGVPEPARRYLQHALGQNIPLKTRVELKGEGAIRIGETFRPFRSWQLLAPGRGFVWRAHFQMPLRVADHYADDAGEVRGLFYGCLPLLRADGPDVSRACRHRLAIESIWLPDALLPIRGVSWERISETQARAKLLVDHEPIDLLLTIARDGRLERAEMRRFSDRPPDQVFRFRHYVALFEAEATFDGRTIPSVAAVGYADEAGGAVDVGFRVTIDQATFR